MILGISKGKIPFEFDEEHQFMSLCPNCNASPIFSWEQMKYSVDEDGFLKELRFMCPVCEKYFTVYTPPTHEIDEKEDAIRQRVYQRGYGLHKSHKPLGADNLGGYAIFDTRTCTYVHGSHFELSLDDVAEWLDE